MDFRLYILMKLTAHLKRLCFQLDDRKFDDFLQLGKKELYVFDSVNKKRMPSLEL